MLFWFLRTGSAAPPHRRQKHGDPSRVSASSAPRVSPHASHCARKPTLSPFHVPLSFSTRSIARNTGPCGWNSEKTGVTFKPCAAPRRTASPTKTLNPVSFTAGALGATRAPPYWLMSRGGFLPQSASASVLVT